MAELYKNEEVIERVILVGVDLDTGESEEESLDELQELVSTAGAICVGRMIQNREAVHQATYLGKGKIEELKLYIQEKGATGIVCDDELSPAQLSNLEDALDCKVIDRTLLILDIFAARALTKEGKVQVELAQLRYRATRLVGLGHSLSRLGGGIGTRGPGEKKLEMDRRLIRDRISQLSRELKDVVKHREVQRQQRMMNQIPVVCIVGYTNAGKSTLLNLLTDADVLEEDKLFATLDPTTRNYELESGQNILLTDTVGFIKKLPHHLVNAFRSTLEEARYCDILLHVVDASNPHMESQMEAVYETLDMLGVKDKPIITAFNKIDRLEDDSDVRLHDIRADYEVRMSARQNLGVCQVLEDIEQILRNRRVYIEKTFPYDKAGDIQYIRQYGQLIKEEYLENGIYVEAYIPHEIEGKLR
ncbi:MAG: GTPase HflX [Lachnospiraceae bacterium]